MIWQKNFCKDIVTEKRNNRKDSLFLLPRVSRKSLGFATG
jgi:hypothetical protein